VLVPGSTLSRSVFDAVNAFPCVMDDHEGSSEPAGSAGSSPHGILSSAPSLIAAIAGLITAVSGLLIGLNKAGIIGGGDDQTSPPITSTDENGMGSATSNATTTGPDPTTTEPAPSIPFTNEIRPHGSASVDGETLIVTAKTPGRPFLKLADYGENFGDVSMSARVRWVSGAQDSGYSFVCRHESPRSYYLLAVASGSRYNFVRYHDGRPDFLSGGFKVHSAIDPAENAVVARCEGVDPTRLTLIVNGQEIESVEDSDGIDSGEVGVRVGSSEARVTYEFQGIDIQEP
jgi:hypothetical protein